VPGFAEWVVILFVVMFVFAAGKLPEIAASVGRALEHFRHRNSRDREDEDPKPSP
jgi:sec-independent protein translocase protein TatA